MATLTQHIDTLRAKPHHVRERIAFLAAGGASGLVALAWLIALSTSGTLSLKTSDVPAVADGASVKQAVGDTTSNFSQLLGAAGAAMGATSTAAAITVVDTRASSTLDDTSASSATSIPF